MFLTYERGAQEVRVVPFSASRLQVTGPPALTLPGALYPSESRDGTLAYALRVAGDSTGAILLVQNWVEELKVPSGER